MSRTAALSLLCVAACATVRVDADGSAQLRVFGAAHAELHSCGPEAPGKVCAEATGGALSETAGGLLSGLFGLLFGAR